MQVQQLRQQAVMQPAEAIRLLDKVLQELRESQARAGIDLMPRQRLPTADLLMTARSTAQSEVMATLLQLASGKLQRASQLSPARRGRLVAEVLVWLEQQEMEGMATAEASTTGDGDKASTQPRMLFSLEQLHRLAEGNGIHLPAPTPLPPPRLLRNATFQVASTASSDTKEGAPHTQIKSEAVRHGGGLESAGCRVTIPVVFHVLQLKLGGATFPGPSLRAGARRLLERLNYTFSLAEWGQHYEGPPLDSRLRFTLAEVRDNPRQHPYLLMEPLKWLLCNSYDTVNVEHMWDLASESNADSSRFINIYVCGLALSTGGWSDMPDGGGFEERAGGMSILLNYNVVAGTSFNNAESWEHGGWTAAHEMGHFMGLQHPHNDENSCESDGDGLEDTPVTRAPWDQPYSASLKKLCSVWRAGGRWPSGTPWINDSPIGFSRHQMVSCPSASTANKPTGDSSPSALGAHQRRDSQYDSINDPMYDPIYNIMAFTPAPCKSIFTPQQVQFLWYSVPAFHPKLYNASKAQGCP